MNGLVSGVVGGFLAAVLVFGGVATYNATSSTPTDNDPNSVGYADE